MLNDLRIAEMLATRLCHDLTGPIGAVHNGAEFLAEEDSTMQSQALSLIVSSAGEAVQRLQFYRAAYGRVNEQGEASLSERKQLAMQFFKGSRITLDWPDTHADASGISVGHKMARLLFNLLVIAAGSLIKGGTLAVRIGGDAQVGGKKELLLIASGPAVKWEGEVEAAALGKTDIEALSPKTVQAYLTHRLAEELGATLSFNADEEKVELRATQG